MATKKVMKEALIWKMMIFTIISTIWKTIKIWLKRPGPNHIFVEIDSVDESPQHHSHWGYSLEDESVGPE